MYQALKQAGKIGEIQLIGFDENDVTLQAIKDGECIGTVVQNPYEYGYKSVELLSKYLKGDKGAIPESKFIDIPARMIVSQKTLGAAWLACWVTISSRCRRRAANFSSCAHQNPQVLPCGAAVALWAVGAKAFTMNCRSSLV